MKTVQLDKWQRIQYMLCTPLGENRYFVTGCQEHIDLSREAACEGMVLLKNDGLLPFAKGQKIAVFGKAQADYVKGGGGSGDVSTLFIRSLQDGFAEKEGEGKLSVFAPLTEYYYDYVQSQYANRVQPGWVAEPELPAALVEQEKAKLALNQQKLEQVEKRLAELKESL
jgi:beta-glucosidase